MQLFETSASGKRQLEASGQVDKALDSRSEDLGFNSQYWSSVQVLGKLGIPHYLDLPSLAREKVMSVGHS